jgi:hypothetical protein
LGLLFILSYASKKLLSSPFFLGPVTRDILFMRWLAVLLTLGNLFFALALMPWLLVLGLILISAGQAWEPVCRAMLNSIVDAHLIAIMNTAIAAIQQLTVLLSAPLLSQLLRQGFALGGSWIGLPYFLTTAMAAIMSVTAFLFEIPRLSTATLMEFNTAR